jgi:hypothetical protein
MSKFLTCDKCKEDYFYTDDHKCPTPSPEPSTEEDLVGPIVLDTVKFSRECRDEIKNVFMNFDIKHGRILNALEKGIHVLKERNKQLQSENERLKTENKRTHDKAFEHNLRQAKKIASKNARINKTEEQLRKMDIAIIREVRKSQSQSALLERVAPIVKFVAGIGGGWLEIEAYRDLENYEGLYSEDDIRDIFDKATEALTAIEEGEKIK